MSYKSKVLIASLATGLIGVILVISPLGYYIEETIGLHFLFKARGFKRAPPGVVIVTMNRDSIENLNLEQDSAQWPRSLHAGMIKNLLIEGASLIVFDIVFNETRLLEDDNLLINTVSNTSNIILCEEIITERLPLINNNSEEIGHIYIEKLIPPIPPLEKSALAVGPFPLPKVPVKVSQFWTFKRIAKDIPTLPVVAFQAYALGVYDEFIELFEKINPGHIKKFSLDKDTIINDKAVVLLLQNMRNIFKKSPSLAKKMLKELNDNKTSSLNIKRRKAIIKSLIKIYSGMDSRYLNFYGPPATITNIPYYKVLQKDYGELDMKNKVVFVGFAELRTPSKEDYFPYVYTSKSTGVDISGVEIAATAFANLLEDNPVQPLAFSAQLILVIITGMIFGFLCFKLRTLISSAILICIGIIYIFIAKYQFGLNGTWYPLAVPLLSQMPFAFLSTLLWKYVETNRERENIKNVIGYYLPDKVIDQLAKNMGDILLNNETVYGACLITDAERFTSLSEIMDPKELSRYMNKYYEAVFHPVNKHGGTVSTVTGDSMLAIWIANPQDKEIKSQACRAALDITKSVHCFNESSGNFRLPTRIGLHAGYMLLGNIGAISHYEYTPLGDIVNTASRIEGLNKYLNTQLLVSEEILHQLDGFITRELGKFLFLGKSKPTVIYELICGIEESDDSKRRLCTVFSEALSVYRKRLWDEAIGRFNQIIKIYGADGPSEFYLNLCEEYKKSPPGEIWEGLVCLDKK